MSVALKPLVDRVSLQSADPGTAVYTAAVYAFIGKATVRNVDSASHSVDVFITGTNGGAVLDNVEFIETVSVAPGKTEELEKLELHAMAPGEKLFARADANDKLILRVSGLEVDP